MKEAYSDVYRCSGQSGSGRNHTLRQTRIAIGDRVNYEKLPANPVITMTRAAGRKFREDFRDPRMERRKDLYAAVGSLGSDGSGQIALFPLRMPKEWRFESILDANGNGTEKCGKCPDFSRWMGSRC